MSIPGSALTFLGAASGAAADYTIERSLRFNDDDSAYLNKTFSSAGNRETWTWSGWVKRSELGSGRRALFGAYGAANDTDLLEFGYEAGGIYATTNSTSFVTTEVFRDPSAWYHYFARYNGENIKFYINGAEVYSWAKTGNLGIGGAWEHQIGRSPGAGGRYFDGYLAEVYFIDGQALDETYFGEFDGNGVWQPKEFSGEYNGGYNQSQNWTDNITLTFEGNAAAGNNTTVIDNVFDGNISTGFYALDSGVSGSAGLTHKITFPSGVRGSKVRVRVCGDGGYGAALNTETLVAASASYEWLTIYDGTETDINYIAFGNADTGTRDNVTCGIEIDGLLLTDSDISVTDNSFKLDFSDNSSNDALGYDATGTARYYPDVTGTGISSTVKNLFDGNTALSVDGTAGTTITFTPSTPIAYSSSVECYTASGSTDRTYSLNGGTGVTSVANGWTTLATGSGTITSITCTPGSSTYQSWSAIRVDGVILTDPNDWTVNNISAAGPSVTTTGNISLSSASRNFYFKGTSGQSITVSTGNHVWDSSDGISWTYRGTSGTSVSLNNTYVHISGTTGITFTNSSSASVKYWDLALSTGIANGAGTTATFHVEAYGAENIDSLIDTPTNYSVVSENAGGNYCTLNPLSNVSQTLKNGNLVCSGNAGRVTGTMFVGSGKWYFEFKAGSDFTMVGIESSTAPYDPTWPGDNDQQHALYGNNGSGGLWSNNSQTSYPGFVSGDLIGVALDMDGGNLYYYKNGVAMNSGVAAVTGLTGSWTVNARSGSGQYDGDTVFNFGQRPFVYSPGGAGAPSSNYKSWCTQNLPDPTIADGSTKMDILTYPGDGSTSERTITGLNLESSPDLIWVKNKSDTLGTHMIWDAVRGGSLNLTTNQPVAESPLSSWGYGAITGSTSDGIKVQKGSLANAYHVNELDDSYVAWTWDAGANSSKTYAVTVVSGAFRFDGFGSGAVTLDLEEGSTYVFDQSDSSNATHPLRFSTTTDGTHTSGGTEYTTGVTTTGTPGSAGAKTTIVVASGAPTLYYYCSAHSGMGGQANTNSTAGASNFDGSIQSTVRANPEAGCSIVGYTADATSSQTIGHGLNAKPGLIIVKDRDAGINWSVYHQSLDITAGEYLKLNAAEGNLFSNSQYNSTEATTSVFTVGYGGNTNYQTGNEYIAYCFAPVEGYSAFGSYTGNGTATGDGPFIYTGFRPALVLVKESSHTGNNWSIYDTTRNEANVVDLQLKPSANHIEGTNTFADFLSNGFKIKVGTAGLNDTSKTYVYACWAENPFKTARAR